MGRPYDSKRSDRKRRERAKALGKKPTSLQIGTMRQHIENPDKSLNWCMREAGYSEISATDSKKNLETTVGWQVLLKKFMPEDYLVKQHKRLLEKRESSIVGGRFITGDQPHSDVKTALDMAYKLTGRYASEKKEVTHTMKLSEEQLLRIVEHRKYKSEDVVEGEVVEDLEHLGESTSG